MPELTFEAHNLFARQYFGVVPAPSVSVTEVAANDILVVGSDGLWSAMGYRRAPSDVGALQGAGCRVRGAGCRVQGAGCRVQGAGCRVQGAGYRVQGAGCRL